MNAVIGKCPDAAALVAAAGNRFAAPAYEVVSATDLCDCLTQIFDVNQPGSGTEGRINSPLPDTPAVAVAVESQNVVGVEDCLNPPPIRITLTIQRSIEGLVVSGEGKAEALAAAFNGSDPVSIPAAGVLSWEATAQLLFDEAAGGRLYHD